MTEQPQQNHIRCKTILEVLGKPKEHIEKKIKEYITGIRDDSDLIILNESFADPKQQGELWSTFAELEIVVKGIPKLVAFCFDYMPSSIDIIKPDEIIFKSKDVSNMVNDMQARLHGVDMEVKKLNVENDFLKRNMKASFKNSIAVLLKMKDMDDDELSNFTGIPKEEIGVIIEELVKNNKIKKEENKYKLIA
ncbi:MAG: hypothetical protein QF824_03835 [Candidatus Woesearchaeota archaeon]|jgi:hypothetical protein|nr:hypothetical protein [Candidatus Woesearchaeota archaeon]